MRDALGYAGFLVFAVCGSCDMILAAAAGMILFYLGFKPRFEKIGESDYE